MKKGTFFLFLFCIIFMFSGVLVTVLGIGITRDYNEFVKTAKYTKGEIKEIITTRDSDGDASHDVYVKYIVDGEEYEVKSNYYTSSMYVGKEIGVYYDKNNPHKSKVESSVANNTWPIVMGIVFALFGLIPLIIFGVKISRRRKIIKNGICVDAEVVGIDINYNVRVNHRHPYKVIVKATNPLTGESNVYVSHNIYNEVNMYLQLGDTVPIYFDNRTGKQYFIDVESLKDNVKINVFDNSL